jgi:hypothetical protein
MKHIGFRSIDRMVVKKIKNSDHFIVIEGNRRLSSLKILRNGHDNGDSRLKCEDDEVRDTLNQIEVLEISDELEGDELQKFIDRILGIRHHGSLLEWGPLPRAHSIVHVYLRVLRDIRGDQKLNRIERDKTTTDRIAQLLAITPTLVYKALGAYTAFEQVNAHVRGGVKNRYFSLVETLVTNSTLRKLFGIDNTLFTLSDSGLEMLVSICQFETRSKLQDERKILMKPQHVSKLAKLYGYQSDGNKEVRLAAEHQFEQLLEGNIEGDKGEPAVFKAIELLDAVILEHEWPDRLDEYLNKANVSLKVQDYRGVGNARERKDSLLKTVKRMLAVAEIDSE